MDWDTDQGYAHLTSVRTRPVHDQVRQNPNMGYRDHQKIPPLAKKLLAIDKFYKRGSQLPSRTQAPI